MPVLKFMCENTRPSSFFMFRSSHRRRSIKKSLKPATLRSSHQRCSVRKVVLRNFAKFTEKHLRQSLFFNKVTGLRPATLLKKETLAQVFFCEFCEISKNDFFTERLGRLLLNFMKKETPTQIFSREFCEIFKKILFTDSMYYCDICYLQCVPFVAIICHYTSYRHNQSTKIK